jgi:hypothetical protein
LALIVPLGAARASSSPATRLFCGTRKSIGEMDAVELAARHGEVARPFGAAGQATAS